MDIHYQLVPYLLSTGSKAYYNGKSSLTPLAAHQNFIEKVTKFMHMITTEPPILSSLMILLLRHITFYLVKIF